MIFDKNVYRRNGLIKSLKIETDPEKRRRIKKRLSNLQKKGPEYWIKLYDDAGKPHPEKVPDKYRGKKGAERYEKLRYGQVETGTFTLVPVKKTKINNICIFSKRISFFHTTWTTNCSEITETP